MHYCTQNPIIKQTLTQLADGHTTCHQDASGQPFTRVTFQNTRVQPTAVEWTADVWRTVREQLGQTPPIDPDEVEAALALERNRAARRLEERFGVLITDTQTIAPQSVEIARPPVIQPQRADDSGGPPPQPAEPLELAAQPSGSRPVRKEPSKDAFAAYRLQLLTGKTQKELAEQLTAELRRPVGQGTVSRWLKQVRAWLKAGNVLPDLTTTRTSKPHSHS